MPINKGNARYQEQLKRIIPSSTNFRCIACCFNQISMYAKRDMQEQFKPSCLSLTYLIIHSMIISGIYSIPVLGSLYVVSEESPPDGFFTTSKVASTSPSSNNAFNAYMPESSVFRKASFILKITLPLSLS